MATPLSQNLPWDVANSQWAASLNPLLANPLNGVKLLSIPLNNGMTTFNHGLGRVMQGWFINDLTGPATIYRSQPLNANTLTLTSNAAVTVSIGVY